MFIRSERLFLRPGWPEDWNEVFAQIADETVTRNLAHVPWPYTENCAREFVSMAQDARCPHFLITLPGSHGAQLIGCIGLRPGDDGVELGYWIGRNHWDRGFATEAARALLSLAVTLGHRRIVARHYIDNPASGRVLCKLGFTPTGSLEASFSHARGTKAPSALLALELSQPVDGDGQVGMPEGLRAA